MTTTDPVPRFDRVTTATARKRHLARHGDTYTLCHTVAARPGDRHLAGGRGRISQQWIDALELCEACARQADA